MLVKKSKTTGYKLQDRGFTLIELLVVIAIIGLIASIILLMLSGIKVKARDAKRKSDVTEMVKVIELYKDQNNDKLPGTAGGVYRSDDDASWGLFLTALNGGQGGKIIAALPQDPAKGPGRGYYYYASSNPSTLSDYEIGATVELCVNGQGDGGDDNDQPPGNNGTAGTFYESGSNPRTLMSGGIQSAGCK